MNRPRESHTKWRTTNSIWYHLYVKSKKNIQMNLSTKQTHRRREQTCGCQGGRGVGEGWIGSLGFADENYYI